MAYRPTYRTFSSGYSPTVSRDGGPSDIPPHEFFLGRPASDGSALLGGPMGGPTPIGGGGAALLGGPMGGPTPISGGGPALLGGPMGTPPASGPPAALLGGPGGGPTPSSGRGPAGYAPYGPTVIPPGMDEREYWLRQTPGYEWAFNEGQRGIQNSAAARGTLLTGGTLKALARYGTGLADQLYGNTINRYLSLADLGARTATAPFA